MLFFQFQEPDLLIKRFAPVKPGAADDLPDILQGKFQLPEQKDLLQDLQIRFVIQAVPGLRMPGRMKQSDPVVILQGADTLTSFTVIITVVPLTSDSITLNYDVT